MLVTYDFPASLRDTMVIVQEVRAELGIEPATIRCEDGECLAKFDQGDSARVVRGEMSESEYLEKHRI